MCVSFAALALAGCGLGAGPAPTTVQLLVTREYGSQVLHRSGSLSARGHETVLGLLRRELPVATTAGGRAVAAIGGLSAGRQAGHEQPLVWLYYVNGVQVSSAPGATSVHPGDHIWWDLHEAGRAAGTTAVVGAFPEPFLNGIAGDRLPVRVECASGSGHACSVVTASLRRFGVPAAVAAIGSGGAPETLRVLVGEWARVAGELAAQSIGRGPAFSGVFARFSSAGQALTLLDAQGGAVGTLSADAGLVAATRGAGEAPLWVVTGTDAAGVELAARAFNRATLDHRFALALAPGAAIALPAPAPSAR